MQHKTKNTIDEKSYSWNSSRQVNICLSPSVYSLLNPEKIKTYTEKSKNYRLCSVFCMPVIHARLRRISLEKFLKI